MQGGGKGGRERTWAATLHQSKKLAEPRRGQPAREAGIRTPGPGRGGLGGAWLRRKPWAEPGGTCGRRGRVAQARPGRAASATGALVYQHTCVLFSKWNVRLAVRRARGAARVGGGNGVRPALPQPPRALLARQPGWLVTRFPRSPEVPATHLDGETLALPKQLRRPRAPTKKRYLPRVLFGLLPSPEQSHSLRYNPVHTPGPRGGLCVVCALAPNIPKSFELHGSPHLRVNTLPSPRLVSGKGS